MNKTANCLHCNMEDTTENMIQIKSPSKNYFYVCPRCSTREYGYNDENEIFTHKAAKHGLTWSIELETSDRNMESNWLYQYNFLPSSDGSISGTEWKSPIWKNLSGLNQLFRTIEKKTETGSGCGTHLNIGTYNYTTMQMITRYYHSLFIPLCKHMEDNTHKVEKLYGRSFTHYAYMIDSNTYATNHENFINVQHNTHLEFRLCKFINADQFMNCLKACTEMVKAINANFINHFNDHETDNSITDINAYRKHKANITAKKLIRIFDKYTHSDGLYNL